MAGLIQQAMPQGAAPAEDPREQAMDQPGAPEAGPADQAQDQAPPQGGEGDFSPASVRAGMHLPPGLQDAYERVVAAGMKVMFDPATHDQMTQLLQQPGSMGEKLGKGIAGLMLLLYQQSNKTLPPQVIIPAGIELASHAVDFLKQAGQEVQMQDVGEGVTIFLTTIMQKFGLDPSKVIAHVDGAQQPDQQQQPQPGDQAPEPDADQAGGPPDADADDQQE